MLHPTLAAFADRYRHAFPDLTLTEDHRKQEIRAEWQEAPGAPCYAVTMYMDAGGADVCLDYTGGNARGEGDFLTCLVAVMARERALSAFAGPILAAPGTFGALVLERRLLAARPQSPDRLN